MRREVCTDFRGCHFVEGAGHWVQQEQPGKTVELLLDFLRTAA
jgi:pimeloyl-ACP methyl ester carboxylesterase